MVDFLLWMKSTFFFLQITFFFLLHICWCVDVLMCCVDVLMCWCVDMWFVDVLMCWCVDVDNIKRGDIFFSWTGIFPHSKTTSLIEQPPNLHGEWLWKCCDGLTFSNIDANSGNLDENLEHHQVFVLFPTCLRFSNRAVDAFRLYLLWKLYLIDCECWRSTTWKFSRFEAVGLGICYKSDNYEFCEVSSCDILDCATITHSG